MQSVVSIVYYGAVLYFGMLIIWNFATTRDIQKAILYLVVLAPFVLRILRLK